MAVAGTALDGQKHGRPRDDRGGCIASGNGRERIAEPASAPAPADKTTDAIETEEYLPPADQRNLAFVVTAVTSASGWGVVAQDTQTGGSTTPCGWAGRSMPSTNWPRSTD